jgi:hypothetical protein
MLALIQDWTLMVRGARQGYQTRQYATELAEAIDQSFRHHMGCNASAVVAAFAEMVAIAKRRLQAHMGEVRSWMRSKNATRAIEAFLSSTPLAERPEVSAKAMAFGKDLPKLREYLWNVAENRARAIFTFDLGELTAGAPPSQRQALEKIIVGRALEFGEMTAADLEHLHLSNPVQLRPLILLDERTVFCASPMLVTLNLAEIVEDLCGANDKLKKAAERARAEWLEARLSGLVRKYLPHADVRENVKWTDEGVTWECDVVAVLDRTVIVFEAKSAKIRAAARRGATTSLKSTLHELVVAPSEQSLRFKRRVLEANETLTFQTNTGPLEVDPTDLKDIARVNVLQDVVGPLSAHWPQLKAAGLIPADVDIAPSMSVFELETVFDLLTLEVERCHYLARRAELEWNATYIADELDLLAVYLQTQFNIGDSEFGGSILGFYGESLNLAPTYDDEGVKLPLRLTPRRTPFWSQLLESLEAVRPIGWTRFGHRLLNFDFDNQKRIERLLKAGLRHVRNKPGDRYAMGVTVTSSKRRRTIAVCVSKPGPFEQLQYDHSHVARLTFAEGPRTMC